LATVYFLCGMAASGKTTFAKKLAAEKAAVRFTLDERMIAKYDYSIYDEAYGDLAGKEKLLIWEEAKTVLAFGVDVVLDWSLWSKQARQEWSQKALAAGYDYKLYYLKVPLEALRQRLVSRNDSAQLFTHFIPVEELERFSGIFEPPTSTENLKLEIIMEG